MKTITKIRRFKNSSIFSPPFFQCMFGDNSDLNSKNVQIYLINHRILEILEEK